MACTSSQASLFAVGSQHPFPATGFKLGLLSPPLSGCPRRLRALSLQQLPRIPSPVNPTGSQSGPHPHLISAPLPKMGARNRGTSFFSLSVFPPLPTPSLPLLPEKSSPKKKGKQVKCLQWGCWGQQKREPRLKRRGTGYKPRSRRSRSTTGERRGEGWSLVPRPELGSEESTRGLWGMVECGEGEL